MRRTRGWAMRTIYDAPPTALIRRQYRPSSPAPIHTIQQALLAIGMPPERLYAKHTDENRRTRRGHSSRRTTGFWEQPPAVLQALADDAKHVFRHQLRTVRHDFPESHEAAVQLIGAWWFAKKLFRRHGIVV